MEVAKGSLQLFPIIFAWDLHSCREDYNRGLDVWSCAFSEEEYVRYQPVESYILPFTQHVTQLVYLEKVVSCRCFYLFHYVFWKFVYRFCDIYVH